MIESAAGETKMKRYGNLWTKVVDIDNILLAINNAQRGKIAKYKRVKNWRKVREIERVLANKEFYALKIQRLLKTKKYRTSRYFEFTINDNGKERTICDLPFYPDRIVHWALIQVLEPCFMKQFISQTYAALPDRGTHKALKKLREYLSEKPKYCAKLDVRKFFPSIDKEVLKRLLRKKFKDEGVLWLLDEVIDSYPKGLPIGNYTSQFLGNFYLNEFDHWIKEEKGVQFYLRYMDDIIILSDDKGELHGLIEEIDGYLKTNLKLEIKANVQVFPIAARGVDFVGYRSFEKFTLLRRRTKEKLKKVTKRALRGKVKNLENVLGSYNGILKWGDCFRLRAATIEKIKGGLNGLR